MELGAVQNLVERVAGVDASCADRVVLEAAVRDVRRLRSWIEAREVAFAGGLAEVSSFPEKSLADASRSSIRHAEQVLRRAETAGALPGFAGSLDGGWVTGEHVDV
ncbi:MAG: hypothetical protein QOC57_666, partial [Ilumatobacteraceae bacterium]